MIRTIRNTSCFLLFVCFFFFFLIIERVRWCKDNKKGGRVNPTAFRIRSILLFYNAFRLAYEVKDIVYFVTHRHLVFNLLQSIMYTEVTLINQSVSIYDMTQNAVCYLMLVLQYNCIDTMIFCRVTIHDNIWWNVLRNAAS